MCYKVHSVCIRRPMLSPFGRFAIFLDIYFSGESYMKVFSSSEQNPRDSLQDRQALTINCLLSMTSVNSQVQLGPGTSFHLEPPWVKRVEGCYCLYLQLYMYMSLDHEGR